MSKGPDEAKLFIGNISYDTRDRDLEELFSKYGKVKECRCAVDTATGRNKGFGFVTMEVAADAADAVKETDGIELLGRTIRVEVSTGIRGAGGGGGGRRDNRDDRDRNDRSYGRDRDDRNSDRSYGRDRGRDDDRRDDRSYGRSDRDGRRDDERSYGRDRDSRPSYRDDKDDRREKRDRSRDRDGY